MTVQTTRTLTIEPLDVARDADLLFQWVTHPRSVYWGMQESTPDEVAAAYAEIVADPHHDAFLGRADGEPQFLVERYDPVLRELVGVPELREGDIGMHVLVAPTDTPQHGFTADVMRAVVQFCFEQPQVRRVVVEPDVRNDKIAALNAAAGFRVEREVQLKDKVAALSFCTREDFAASELGGDA